MRKFFGICNFTFAVLAGAGVYPVVSGASPVYETRDSKGHPVYSSKPRGSGRNIQSELPEIMKGGVKPATGKGGQSCSDHQGTNCIAGPDADGSVVCSDGYRDSGLIYRYVCPTPHLELLSITQQEGSPSALIVLRNTRQVEALSPAVKIRSRTGPTVLLNGPSRLEGGAIGVFDLVVPKGVLPGGSQKLLRNHLWITCGNCG